MLTVPRQQEPSQSATTPTRVWIRRLVILLTILAALTLAAVIFWSASHVISSLLIVLIAALVAYAIVPVVDFFDRVMPRPLAILLAYVLVFIMLGAVLYVVVGTAVGQISVIGHNFTFWLTPTKNKTSPLLQLLTNFGLRSNQIQNIQQQVVGALSGIATSVAGGLVPILGSVAGGLLDILLTVVISIYLLVDGSRAVRWMRQAFPSSRRMQVNATIDTLQRVVGGYIRGQILLCGIIGFVVGAGLWLLGFPFAALMGVLTFITEFIPVLGTIFAGAVAVLLALNQGWGMTIVVLAFFVVVHIFEGYILAPRLIGKAVQLNPAIMLIALTVGAELFGPFGAIFAAPTAGILQAFFEALWFQYRNTHKEEFQDEEQQATTKGNDTKPLTDTAPINGVQQNGMSGDKGMPEVSQG